MFTHIINKSLIIFRFLFRKRLYISSELIKSTINDFEYFVNYQNAKNYNEIVNYNNKETKTAIHPLFYTKISWQIIENLNKYINPKMDERILKTIVHQSENIQFYQSISLPVSFIVKTKIWKLSKHKKGTKILIRFDYYADNKLVATEYSGGLLYGVKLKGKDERMGNLPLTERVSTMPVWEEHININKDLPYIYAKKAEIDAPIHTNPKFAKSIGLPDIILQGTCTFAQSISLILAKELNNDISCIQLVNAKFTGMLVAPNKITIRLLNKNKSKLFFDVLNSQGKAVIKGGEIILKD